MQFWVQIKQPLVASKAYPAWHAVHLPVLSQAAHLLGSHATQELFLSQYPIIQVKGTSVALQVLALVSVHLVHDFLSVAGVVI